ncbi:hypothetical protein AB205_0183650, partial [Aquarana catesbeiana]
MAMRQTPLTCSGHTRPVVDLAFSGVTPYGFFLISACKDGKPMLRQGDTGDWIGTFLGHKGAVWGATLNKDATKAATAAADFTAKVWDAVTGDELFTLAHKHIVKSVDFTEDSSHLLTAGQDKLLRIYDLHKPEAGRCDVGGGVPPSSVLFCERVGDGWQLWWSGLHDGVLYDVSHCVQLVCINNHCWVGGNGDALKLTLLLLLVDPEQIGGHTSAIKKALWYNNDRQIISAADDKTVRLWDRASMTEIKTLNFNLSVSSMEYIPEGDTLLITYGRTIALYNSS